MKPDVRHEAAAEAVAQPDADGIELLRLLRDQPLEGCERSFKMLAGELLANRYLIGVHRSRISAERIHAICAATGMPERFRVDFRRNLSKANAVHFGFEGSGAGGLYKVYLEFAGRLRWADPGGKPEGVLLHLAYKWASRAPEQCTIAKYHCHPGLSTDAILARVEGVYSGNGGEVSLEVARKIIGFAAERAAEPLMYLEVREEGNARLSFDINLHGAGLFVGDAWEWLAAASDAYSVPDAEFSRLHAQVATEKLGHLSGGLNREGRDFLTVYYDADRP